MKALATVQPQPDDFEEEPEALDPKIMADRLLEASQAIVGRLDLLAQDNARRRQSIEDRWIKNIRQYLGIYAPERLIEFKNADQSTVFVNITRHKTNGWSARVSDLLFPTDDKNWGIGATPIPTLTGKAKEAAAAAMAKVAEANAAADQGDPTAEQIAAQAGEFAQQVRTHYATIDEAKRRSEWMERTIEDQLTESDYVTECRDVIEDGCKLGTGILKGPTTVQSLRRQWTQQQAPAGAAGAWVMGENPDPRPMFCRVNPWFFFPDMSATSIKGAEFTFELSLPSRKDLKRAARKLGFNVDAVKRLLDQGPPVAISSVLTRLAEIRALTGDNDEIKDRYLQWEYNGPLEAEEIANILRGMGQNEEADAFEQNADPLEEYRVIAWFIGNEVLRIAPDYPLDSGDGLYSVWCFEKSEASIFGIGVPDLLEDPQSSLNTAWRMMHDNGALTVGPQLVFDKGAITPQDGQWGLKPLKIWLRSSTAYTSPQNRPFDVFDVPNKQQEYSGIITLAKEFADEEASMPEIAQGEQGNASSTMGGMSMLFNSANVVFRRVVKAWDDDLTKPTIRRAYDWNMQFNTDETIKGDMKVDARGTSVLLVREMQSQNLMAIMNNWPANAYIGPYIKVREGLVKTVQTMMIPPDDILYQQDEVDKKQAAAAAQKQQTDPVTQMKLQMAQMQHDAAKYEADTRKAIAEMQAQVALTKISEESGLSQAEVQQRFQLERDKLQSGERMKAVDIAVEDRRAQEARAEGQPEAAATGKGIG